MTEAREVTERWHMCYGGEPQEIGSPKRHIATLRGTEADGKLIRAAPEAARLLADLIPSLRSERKRRLIRDWQHRAGLFEEE